MNEIEETCLEKRQSILFTDIIPQEATREMIVREYNSIYSRFQEHLIELKRIASEENEFVLRAPTGQCVADLKIEFKAEK